ncbi:MAG: hypothetical protein AB7E81_03435 [Hyphomicrobiaceae bacterium]
MAAAPCIDPASGDLTSTLGITDPGALQEAEYALVQKAALEALKYADGAPDLDKAALEEIHHILFKDVYDWACGVRKIALAKGKAHPDIAKFPVTPAPALSLDNSKEVSMRSVRGCLIRHYGHG